MPSGERSDSRGDGLTTRKFLGGTATAAGSLSGCLDDGESDRVTTTSDTPAATTDAVNEHGSGPLTAQREQAYNTSYVAAESGVATINETLQSAGGDGDRIVVYGSEEPVEWTETLFVPSNTRVEFRNLHVTVPASADLTAETPANNSNYRVASLLRNEDWEDGDEAITIAGGFFDFSDVSLDTHLAAVYFNKCDSARVERFEAVGGEGSWLGEAVGLHDCSNSSIVECVGRNWNYQGLGIQGGVNCSIVRSEGHDNGSRGPHAMQIHPTFHSPRQNGKDHTLVECRGTPADEANGKFIIHSHSEGEPVKNVTFERCTGSFFRLMGQVDGVTLRDCHGTATTTRAPVVVQSYKAGDVSQGIVIDGLEARPEQNAAVRILSRNDEVSFENVSILNTHAAVGSGQALCRITKGVAPFLDVDIEDLSDPLVENLRIENCSVRGGSAITALQRTGADSIWVDGVDADVDSDMVRTTDSEVNFYSVENSDLRDVANPTNGDEFASTVNRRNNRTELS